MPMESREIRMVFTTHRATKDFRVKVAWLSSCQIEVDEKQSKLCQDRALMDTLKGLVAEAAR